MPKKTIPGVQKKLCEKNLCRVPKEIFLGFKKCNLGKKVMIFLRYVHACLSSHPSGYLVKDAM